MSDNQGNTTAQEKTELKTILNPSIQPIYADHIMQVAMEPSTLKLVLGCRVNNQVVNNATIVLPLNVVLGLQDALKDMFSNPDIQQLILTDFEKNCNQLKERFGKK